MRFGVPTRGAMIVCASVWLASSTAAAQSASANATRRLLIEQAGQARTAGDHTHAIDLASRAAEIRMSVSLRMFLAEEQAAVGQLTQALDNAETCTREVRTEAGVTDRDTVADHCRSLVETLRARVANVIVQYSGPRAGVTVRVGEDTLPPALWGVPYVVNPGSVAIDATGPHGLRFHRDVTLAESQRETVEITLAEPNAVASGAPALESSAPPASPAPDEHATQPPRAGPPIGSFVVMGVGGATLIASGVFWGLRAAAFSGCSWDASSTVGYCDTPAQVQHATNEGRTYNIVAPVTLGAGLAILAGGFAWWLFGRPRVASSMNASAWAAPSADGAMAGVSARF